LLIYFVMGKGENKIPKVRVELPEENSAQPKMDVVALAVRRIEIRKSALPEAKRHALEKEVETFIQEPKSYTEWAVKYLWENRDALAKAIQQDLFDKGPNTISSDELISSWTDIFIRILPKK